MFGSCIAVFVLAALYYNFSFYFPAMFGSCIAVFVLAALYEGLKVVRETLLRRSTVNVRYHTMPLKREEGTVIEQSFKTVG